MCVLKHYTACTGNFYLSSRIKTMYVDQHEHSNKISLKFFLNKLSFSLRTGATIERRNFGIYRQNLYWKIVYEYVRRPCRKTGRFYVYTWLIGSFYMEIRRNKIIIGPKTVLRPNRFGTTACNSFVHRWHNVEK